ncbi:MAG TPA: GNAT family N-acetyltransferase [Candidatus Deferrimicrobium sp.]|nr:GNAT family N-acetyltransferase [Candidatus Deferrimicrobium sp.]
MISVKCFPSIHDINESLWNSIVDKGDFFHHYRFVQSIEDAKVENSRCWYLLFYAQNKLVGSAALSAFKISLDLFLSPNAQKFIQWVRKKFPNFFKIKILFCGLPISIGKHNLVIQDPAHRNEILHALVEEMRRICREQEIKYMSVKEFCRDQIQDMDELTAHGFFRAPSLPYVSMPVRWPNFDEYLAALRHKYRRQIKNNLKQMEAASVESVPGLILGDSALCPAEQFHRLYLQVMNQAGVQLETLNQSFFEHLFKNMQEQLEILTYQQHGEVLGAALLYVHDKVMTFLLVGIDYSRRDEFALYFNLIYSILKLAMVRGCQQLDLGQTSYYIKQRIGGLCIPTYFYIKSLSPAVHTCLKIFRRFLFPELVVSTHHVFR